jgi:tetratricopeptide (TPR) repeat protein
MQRQPSITGRKMIPRWRGLQATPSQELFSSKNRKLVTTPGGSDDILAEWIRAPTPWSAADLVAMALVEGRSAEADKAAAFLRTMMDGLAPGVRQLVLSYDDPRQFPMKPSAVQTPPEVKWRHIAELKSEIRTYPRNAILYVELARAHVSLGQTGPAKRAFEIALALAPSNRYVLRCAVRFYVFETEYDRAWSVLANIPRDDPWLIASRVAVADLTGRPQESLRTTRRLIDDGDPGQITELAAAVATLELDAGGNKLAKKLFRRGAEHPTDNTVAQIRWAHQTNGIPFDQVLLQTDLSFEARTGQAVEEQKWQVATDNASTWFGDEPFSTRAASTGAFIAAEMLQDFERANLIASMGLVVSPHDPILLNNRAYALACLGNTAAATEDLKSARGLPLDETDEICLLATEGCILYRSGEPKAGAERYHAAIEYGVDHKLPELSQRAYIHWIYEDGRRGHRLSEGEAVKIRNFFNENKHVSKDTRAIYDLYASPYLTGSNDGSENSDLIGTSIILRAL